MEQDEALQLAVAFLAESQSEYEPPLAIDTERVSQSNGLLIVPYNTDEAQPPAHGPGSQRLV
ncbi:hypothetical protein [Streptomyces sp. 4N124]|uniref:hypothetical protein n=1 Tax=Streptomyces sp. 4N124 TaxID=3457420 RepID=UPI003FD654EF